MHGGRRCPEARSADLSVLCAEEIFSSVMSDKHPNSRFGKEKDLGGCGGSIVGPELGPAFVACSTKSAEGKPGWISHVMRAATDVTDSVNTCSTCYCLFQRCYRDQTNSR